MTIVSGHITSISSSNAPSNRTTPLLTLLASLSNRLPENCRAYCQGKAPPSTFNYAKIVRACSFYINTVLTVCLFTRGVVQWMEGRGAQVNNTVVLLVVSRSRTVVTLNREFLFFNATHTNWNACCGEKKDNHSTIYGRRGLSACFTRVALFILSSSPDINKTAVAAFSLCSPLVTDPAGSLRPVCVED